MLRASGFVVCLALLVGLVVMPTSAFAWGALAHVESAPMDPAIEDLTYEINGPDYWGTSYELNFRLNGIDFRAGGEVKHLFAWTHGCQRQGVNGNGIVQIPAPFPLPSGFLWLYVPTVPTTYGSPGGVTIAEWDMYHLVKQMEPAHRGSLMLSMTRGWLAHNILDAAAHFNIFGGAPVDSLDFTDWAIHAVKEEYMDYIILFHLFPEMEQEYLHQQGLSYRPPGLGADADPSLILLGQKCFRKNRQTVDHSDRPARSRRYEPLQVQDLWTINGMFLKQNTDLAGFTFTSDRYQQLHRALCGFGPEEVNSVDTVVLMLTAMKNVFQHSQAALDDWANATYQTFEAARIAARAAPAQMPDP